MLVALAGVCFLLLATLLGGLCRSLAFLASSRRCRSAFETKPLGAAWSFLMADTSHAGGFFDFVRLLSSAASRGCSICSRIFSSAWSCTNSLAMAGVTPRRISSDSSSVCPVSAMRGMGSSGSISSTVGTAPFGECLEFSPGLRAGHVEHDPVGFAVAVGRLLKIDLGDITRFAVRAMNLVHLAADMLPIEVAGLRGMGTKLGIGELGPRPVVFQWRRTSGS